MFAWFLLLQTARVLAVIDAVLPGACSGGSSGDSGGSSSSGSGSSSSGGTAPPLALDVLAALRGAAARRHFGGRTAANLPKVRSVRHAVGAEGVAPAKLDALLQQLALGNSPATLDELPETTAAAAAAAAPAAPFPSFNVVEWTREPRLGATGGAACAATAGLRRLLPLLRGSAGVHARGFRTHAPASVNALAGAFDGTVVGTTQLRVSNSARVQSHSHLVEAGSAAYVAVHDTSLLPLFDVLASAQRGATIVINVAPKAAGEDEQQQQQQQQQQEDLAQLLAARLTPTFRRAAAQRAVALVAVDAPALALAAGVAPEEPPAMLIARGMELALLALAFGSGLLGKCGVHTAAAATLPSMLDAWAAAIGGGADGAKALGALGASTEPAIDGGSARHAICSLNYPARAWLAAAADVASMQLLAIAGDEAGALRRTACGGPLPRAGRLAHADAADAAAAGAAASSSAAADAAAAATPEGSARPLAEHQTAWRLLFPAAHGASQQLRGGVDVGGMPGMPSSAVFEGRVTNHSRLTPHDYDRNIFDIQIDIAGTGLTYTMGDALAIYPQNDTARVRAFLAAAYGGGAAEFGATSVEVKTELQEEEGVERALLLSVEQLLVQVLDIFGQPSKKFYATLGAIATAAAAAAAAAGGEADAALAEAGAALARIGSPEGKDDFEARTKETTTYADVLLEFEAVRARLAELLPPHALVALVHRLKSRLYSIASSSKVHPNAVHLLVVVDDWTTPGGKYRVGLCSGYLESLKAAAAAAAAAAAPTGALQTYSARAAATAPTPSRRMTVGVQGSLMRLPDDPTRPIVMAGTGTGMAPFRAFLEHRAFERNVEGAAIGESVLYFGARYSAKEFLYKNDIESWDRGGVLTHFRPAWSRDGPEKVYIQHLIAADGELLWDLLVVKGGTFYLCGAAGQMPTDVQNGIIKGFAAAGGLSEDEAFNKLRDLKEEGRYVIEVY